MKVYIWCEDIKGTGSYAKRTNDGSNRNLFILRYYYLTTFTIHSKYFPDSDWLKAHV